MKGSSIQAVVWAADLATGKSAQGPALHPSGAQRVQNMPLQDERVRAEQIGPGERSRQVIPAAPMTLSLTILKTWDLQTDALAQPRVRG